MKVLQLLMFLKQIDKSVQKPNKIRADKGREFYKGSMKSWLQHHDIEM